MAFWWILIVLSSFGKAQPHCFFCSKECSQVSQSSKNISKPISLYCNSSNSDISEFIEANTFDGVYKLSLRTLALFSVNYTKLSKVTVVDLAYNNLDVFNISDFLLLQTLNLSHNLIEEFRVNYSQLTNLDLSHNLIANISQSNFQLPALYRLNLSYNKIQNIANFSSDKLKYLDLANNQIQLLEFGNLNRLKTLNLSNNSISIVTAQLPFITPNLEILNISFNLIHNLKDSNFKLQSLLKLDLKGNQISTLSQKCFFGLNKLQFLDISGNKLKIISPNTLQYLPSLVHLYLSENEALNSKDFGLLLATRRLQHVDASRTNQIKIPSSLTRSVRYLNLHGNNISDVQSGDLDSYPLLTILDLSNNNISRIEDDSLGRLELLMTLVLSRNSLTTVPHTLPGNLKNLYLDCNKIKQITNTDFIGLTQLKRLDLSFNKISEISDGSFSQLKVLEFLNLSRNAISMLSSSTFLGIHKLKILDLSHLSEVKSCDQPLCFPIPESNQIQELHLQYSPTLVVRLMNDVAALKTLKQLSLLDISYSNLTSLRKDILNFFPRIIIVNLQGNNFNCSHLVNIAQFIHLNAINDCYLPENVHSIMSNDIATESRVKSNPPPITTLEPQTGTSSANDKEVPSTETNSISSNFILFAENITENSNLSLSSDAYLNEEWLKESRPGIVYAFSSEVPITHPGLFIMLLLPLALVSACLAFSYSRMKNNARNYEIVYGPDIEFSAFSNELW